MLKYFFVIPFRSYNGQWHAFVVRVCIKSQITADSPLDLTVLDQHLIILCYFILKYVLKTVWGGWGSHRQRAKRKGTGVLLIPFECLGLEISQVFSVPGFIPAHRVHGKITEAVKLELWRRKFTWGSDTRSAAFRLVSRGLFSVSQKLPYSLAQPLGSVKRVLFQDWNSRKH